MPPTLFIIASEFAPMICGDAAQDKIDQIVRNHGPWWKVRAIYETLKSGDRDAWTIVALVVGGNCSSHCRTDRHEESLE